MHLRFSAPWSPLLTTLSALTVGLAIFFLSAGLTVAAVILVLVLALAAWFAIVGYVVETDAVIVRRPLSQVRLPLDGLESVEADPAAMRWALRTFGIGGPFAFVGHYRSGRLGAFTAYATDRKRAVVLRWPSRAVVVTPDDPETFVAAVAAAADLG